jgi:hypothetical protein
LLSGTKQILVIEPEMLKKLKGLETEAILLAEKDDIDGAIAKFSEAIDLCPNYASAYNNRYLPIVPVLRLLTKEGSSWRGRCTICFFRKLIAVLVDMYCCCFLHELGHRLTEFRTTMPRLFRIWIRRSSTQADRFLSSSR